jgi:DNA helicase-2/ATP-dependent DNA helicase PcrA
MDATSINNFNIFLSTALNDPQRDAVMLNSGACMVVAGAGSGKTRVITARIAHLIINHHVDPSSIIALTFTNKAAGEMKERLTNFLGFEKKLPFVGTFHAYCLLLLKNNSHLLAYPQFSIIDADDQHEIIKKILKKYGLTKHSTPSQVCYQISHYKNQNILERDSQHLDSFFTQKFIKAVYLEYELEKQQAHCFDFDDLLITVHSLLKNNKNFQKNHQEKIKHILIDEYQDTSIVQHSFLKYLSLDDQQFVLNSLCAVGDEDQSIYSWRGASVTNMLHFQSDFAPVTIIKIEQNYRSVQPILEVANTVIAHNKQRNKKILWSSQKASQRILLGLCRSGEQEATVLAQFLSSLPKDKKLRSIAILYRTHYQSRAIEEALLYASIPYRIIGGIQFYERKEIKDLLAYLRLFANPFDKISLLRIINTPARGLGEKFEQQLLEAWQQNPFFNFIQLLQWMISPNSPHAITPTKIEALKDFLLLFEQPQDNTAFLTSTVINHVLTNTDYMQYLRNEYDPIDAETKIENVREFVESIYFFEKNYTSKNTKTLFSDQAISPTLDVFLQEVSLIQDKIHNREDGDYVSLMTLHAAKGLEFDTIIITGLEEGVLPSSKSLNDPDALEEERRLLYVGITRAREYLVLLYASYRHTFGQITDQIPSRFLSEMPNTLITSVNFENIHQSHSKDVFLNWLGHKRVHDLVTFSSKSSLNESRSIKREFKKIIKKTESIYPSMPAHNHESWQKSALVNHKTFGQGIILNVEKAHEENFYLTIAFKSGTRKILSSFVEKL